MSNHKRVQDDLASPESFRTCILNRLGSGPDGRQFFQHMSMTSPNFYRTIFNAESCKILSVLLFLSLSRQFFCHSEVRRRMSYDWICEKKFEKYYEKYLYRTDFMELEIWMMKLQERFLAQ